MKYRVFGKVTGTIDLGIVEAASEEEAVEKGLDSKYNHIGLCHYCSDRLELDDYTCHDGYADID